MTIDKDFLSMLVCPACKGGLELYATEGADGEELRCGACRLAFPVKGGIPVLLVDEAKSLD